MHIIVFSPLYPPHIGGLESHSDEFNKYVSEEGVVITVFTSRLPFDAPAQEIRHGSVRVIRFPAVELIHNYPFPRFWTAEFWEQWRALKREPCDIVLSRTRFFFPTLMALRFARSRSVPLVHIEHGSDFAQFNGRAKTFIGKVYDYVFGRFVLRRADAVVANSKASAAFVCRLSSRDRCQVIYRGIEKALLAQAEANQALRAQLDGAVITFIGRLIDGKGVHDLLAALAPLTSHVFTLLIVGDGPERSKLERLSVKFSLGERVRFLGNLPFEEAMGALKISDIFVNPSYTEGIPTAVIEAAMCRKAIVATDVGGTPEIITGNNDGFLFDPKDTATLTSLLKKYLEDPELRQRHGEAAERRVREKFDWKHSAQEYMKLLETLT